MFIKFNRLNHIAITAAVLVQIFTGYSFADRGRPYIENNTVITDQGTRMRGTTFWLYGWMSDKVNFAKSTEAWEVFHTYRLNAVRLTCAYRPGHSNNISLDGYQDLLDDFVERCDSLGVYGIVDYHYYPGNYDMDGARDFWNRFAPRYAERTHIFYELTNEPVSWEPKDYRDSNLRDFEELYNLCKGYAPSTMCVLLSFANVGGSGTTAESVADKLNGIDWTENVVGFHSYHRRTADRFINLKNAYPVFNTEFENQGTTGNMKVTTYDGVKYAYHASLMEKLEISWLQWDITEDAGTVANRLPKMINDVQSKGLYWEADDYDRVPNRTEMNEMRLNRLEDRHNSPLQQGFHSSGAQLFSIDGRSVFTRTDHSPLPRTAPISSMAQGSYIVVLPFSETGSTKATDSIVR
jgi:hypothetical protein